MSQVDLYFDAAECANTLRSYTWNCKSVVDGSLIVLPIPEWQVSSSY